MNDIFSLPVSYNGEDFEFPFKIVAQGYSYRYVVLVDEIEVTYERDDQGDFRAVIYNADQVTARLPARGLLEAICSVIQQLAG